MQQGKYAGKLIRSRVTGASPPRAFRYFDKGNMAVVGKGFAVLQSGKFRLSGFLAWLAWAAIHLQFLATSSLRVSVFVQWVWTYITGQRGSRIIVNYHASELRLKNFRHWRRRRFRCCRNGRRSRFLAAMARRSIFAGRREQVCPCGNINMKPAVTSMVVRTPPTNFFPASRLRATVTPTSLDWAAIVSPSDRNVIVKHKSTNKPAVLNLHVGESTRRETTNRPTRSRTLAKAWSHA